MEQKLARKENCVEMFLSILIFISMEFAPLLTFEGLNFYFYGVSSISYFVHIQSVDDAWIHNSILIPVWLTKL